ncbi:uncharacterized protein LOC142622333 isoform X2 [Castanea sativa]|uniref:uncharacterized protein LOC142622333 isoform X2 n=1 Tax=Castanea sativa TaxID=21020 RepID=UPI003F6499D8
MEIRCRTEPTQVLKLTTVLNLLLVVRVWEVGAVKLCAILNSRKGLTPKIRKKIRWILRKSLELFSLFDECLHFLSINFTMNVIAWNCREALKPTFQGHIHDLVQNHDPAIMIVMETKLGGKRAKEITDHLPFDGALHTKTIGYARGLWLLWNSDKVEVEALANTEQEIHVEVKRKVTIPISNPTPKPKIPA